MLIPSNRPLSAPTPAEEDLLRGLAFTEHTPGPILHDFEAVLDFVGEKGLAVSAVEHRLKSGDVLALNERLSRPLPNLFKRVQQKSYPYVHGLYLLLRASGLSYVVQQGRTHRLMLDQAAVSSWDSLNATERYGTLFFTWLMRADEEAIMGDAYRVPIGNLYRCHSFLSHMSSDVEMVSSYSEQENLRYYPAFYNLALLDLFGLVSIEEGEPEPGNGWRVASVRRRPFALPLLNILALLQLEQVRRDDLWMDEGPVLKIEEVQEWFQLYFPAWKHNLVVPDVAPTPGCCIFKVSLGKVWRRIAIPASLTLDDLAFAILDAFDFDDREHLYRFVYRDVFGQVQHVNEAYTEEPPFTKDTHVGDLALRCGERMTFIFDFGDWWEFDLLFERIEADDPNMQKPVLLEAHGDAPLQYPDYDDFEENDYL